VPTAKTDDGEPDIKPVAAAISIAAVALSYDPLHGYKLQTRS
jgi:hypothetical protein